MVNLKTKELERLIEQKFNSKKEFIETAEIDARTLPRIMKNGQCTYTVAQKMASTLEVDFSRIAVDVDHYSVVSAAKGNAQAYLVEEIRTVCQEFRRMHLLDDEMSKELRTHLKECHKMLLDSLKALGDTPELLPKDMNSFSDEEGTDEEFSADNPNPTIDPMTGAPFDQ